MIKKTITLILFVLMAFGPMAWAQQTFDINSESALRQALATSSYPSATYRLTDNITLQNGELTISYGPTIDLNGKYISGGNSSRIFNVSQNAQLTITDNSSNHDGMLTGGSAENGGAIYNAGSLVIENGIIQNCTASNQGGAIYSTGTVTISSGSISSNTAANGGAIHLQGGSLTMTGGSITGNSATGNCGGLNITNGAEVTMSGGSIADNSAGNNDGGVYLGSGSNSFTLTGGSITGNTATRADRGGGISVTSNNFYMSGNPIVSGNTANGNSNNLFLSSDKVITVNGAFTEGANVYVKTEDDALVAFTNGYATHNASTDPSTVFHSDNSDCSVGLFDDEATLLLTWTGGEHITCTLSPDSTFTVSGYGDMANYYNMPGQNNTSPWSAYKDYIKRVVIENGVRAVGAGAFLYCSKLESIDFGWTNNFNIASHAFSHCTSLKTLDIPNTVDYIYSDAFSYCTELTTITIGPNIFSIKETAFQGCRKVEDIYMNSIKVDNNYWWESTAESFKPNKGTRCHVYAHKYHKYCVNFSNINVTFVGDIYPCEYLRSGMTYTLTADNTFTVRGAGPIENFGSAAEVPWYDDNISSQFTSIVIEEQVSSIGDYAFFGCSSATAVTILDNLNYYFMKNFGAHAFDGCSSLTTMTIPPLRNHHWSLGLRRLYQPRYIILLS